MHCLSKSYNIKEFINCLADREIYIYGAGYVANIFLEALEKRGLVDNVQGFIVSQESSVQKNIKGIPIFAIDQININKTALICIAVYEAFKDEIIFNLNQRGVLNYIWIYPFLYELYLGKPVKEKEWVDIKRIIPKNEEQYGIAIRWLAMDDYYGKCIGGFDLYKKAMMIHGNLNTAKARMENFIKLLHHWDITGYEAQWEICINTNYEIIDGEHRVALALYHNQRQLCCRVYEGENIHKKEALMKKEILIQNGFSSEEIKRLDKINLHIRELIS